MYTNTRSVSKTKHNLIEIKKIVEHYFRRQIFAYVFILIIVILTVYISQGSVATQFRRCGIFISYCKLSTECGGERIMKIGQYLVKISTQALSLLLGSPCISSEECILRFGAALFCCMTVCRPLTARTDNRTHLCIA